MEPSPGFLYAPTISKSAFRALLDPKGIMMPPALAASSGIKLEPCGRGNGSPGLPEGWFNAAMLRPSLLTSPMPGWEPVQRASEAAAWEMELRERQQRGVTEEDNKGAEHQIRLSSNRKLGEAAAAAAVKITQDSAPLAKNAVVDDQRRDPTTPTGSIPSGTRPISSSSWQQQQQQQQRETHDVVAPSTRRGAESGERHGAEPNGTSSDAPGSCPQPSRSSSQPTPTSRKREGSRRTPTASLTPPSAVARPSSPQLGGSSEGRRQHQGQEEVEEEVRREEEEELLERFRRCPVSASLWIGDGDNSDGNGDPGMPWRTPQMLAGFTEPQFLLDAEFAAARLRQRSRETQN